jgi:hypothetical protein
LTPAGILDVLSRSVHVEVRQAVASNQAASPGTLIGLAQSCDSQVVKEVVVNPSAPPAALAAASRCDVAAVAEGACVQAVDRVVRGVWTVEDVGWVPVPCLVGWTFGLSVLFDPAMWPLAAVLASSFDGTVAELRSQVAAVLSHRV